MAKGKLKNLKKIILAYIPVLHQGYKEFFDNNRDADELWILGEDFANQFKEIRKDIRRLDPELVARSVESWHLFKTIKVVSPQKLIQELSTIEAEFSGRQSADQLQLVCPNDELVKQVVAQYWPDHLSQKIKYAPVFLRWDRHNAVEEKKVGSNPDQSIKSQLNQSGKSQPKTMDFTDFDRDIMKQAFVAAEHSSDWWRHIGAVLVRDGQVQLISYNQHLPTEHAPYFYNDVRSLFSKGKYFELVSSIHAEAMTIAEAAKRGISTKGADMYVTTFPCPVCAKQVAQSGIKRLFYSGEYSMLDGESILQSAGVELIHVKMSEQDQQEIRDLAAQKSIVKKY